MTAVGLPGAAIYEAIRGAVAAIVEVTPPNARAEVLTRVFRELGTELGEAGLLPAGDTTVEWGVRSPYGMQLGGVVGEADARVVAAQLPGRTIVTRTVTPWVPEQPATDESETQR